MSYLPGDRFYQEFTISNISGVATNADSIPTARFYKNGADDFGVSVFVNNIDIGRYVASGTIPASYARGFSIGVAVTGYVNSLLAKTTLNLGVLDSAIPNVNVVSISGVPTYPVGVQNVNTVSFSGVTINSVPNVFAVNAISITGIVNANVVSVSGVPTYPVGIQNVNAVSFSGILINSVPNVYAVNSVGVSGTIDANVISFSGVPIAGASISGSIISDIRYINGVPTVNYQGIAQGGASASITLSADESSIDNYFNNQYIQLVGGLGVGQVNLILDYDGSTKVADVYSQWATIPDNTSQYVFFGYGNTNVVLVSGVPIAPLGQVNAKLVDSNPGVTVSVTGVQTFGSGSFDNITVENGLNARQALSLMTAVIAGSSTVSSNSVSYYAFGSTSIIRLTATAVSGARKFINWVLPN